MSEVSGEKEMEMKTSANQMTDAVLFRWLLLYRPTSYPFRGNISVWNLTW